VIILNWTCSWIWFRVSSEFIFKNLRLPSIFNYFILWILIFNFFDIKMLFFQTQSFFNLSLQIQLLIIKRASISFKYTSRPLLANLRLIFRALFWNLIINLIILGMCWLIFRIVLLLIKRFGCESSLFKYNLWCMLFITINDHRLVCHHFVLLLSWLVFEVYLASHYRRLSFFLLLKRIFLLTLVIYIILNKFYSNLSWGKIMHSRLII
jgi:hypothetical protein